MQFGGYLPVSLLDFPEKISAVLFTQGCNFRCPFCHNEKLLPFENECLIDEKTVLSFLEKRRNKLDGVVITGGEPTVQKNLLPFIAKVKELGFAIKLDTNGSCPEIIETILATDLIDYWAIDRKASLNRYAVVSGSPIDVQKVVKSSLLIQKSHRPYEFRTTVIPRFHSFEEVQTIAKEISGAETYYLQQFRPEHTLDPLLRTEKAYTAEEMKQLCTICRPYVKNCFWR